MIRYLHRSKRGLATGVGSYKKPKENEFLGLLVTNPTEAEVKSLVADFRISQKFMKSFDKISYSKRLALKPFQFVIVSYFLKNNEVVKTKGLFVLEKNFLVIVSPEDGYYSEFFDLIIDEIKSDRSKARVSYMLYRLLEEDIEEDYEILKVMEQKINQIEELLIHEQLIEPIDLITLKQKLFKLSKSFWASTKIIFNLKTGLIPIKIEPRDQMILDDIYHTLQHQIDVVISQKEMLTDFLNIHVSNISNNLNKVMKFLTALTVIVALPTLLASIYGMNFHFMPLADTEYGFYLMIVLMCVVVGGLYVYFDQKGWL